MGSVLAFTPFDLIYLFFDLKGLEIIELGFV